VALDPPDVLSRRTLAVGVVLCAWWVIISPQQVGGAAGAAQTLPAPWTSQDIGSVGLAGTASESDGVFTIRGAGADIWGSADSFHFMSQPLSGNGEIVARVTSIENTHTYAKAGVMIRGALTAGSAHVILDVKPGGGLEFMSRNTNGGSTAFLAGAAASAPVWLRLQRDGTTIIGSWSSDGHLWTEVGRTTITLPTSVYIGLPVTSHNTAALNTSTFDHVSVAPEVPNQPPAVAITTPVQDATFEAPASIALAATATDPDGAITSVQFLANEVALGTDMTSPYEWLWTGVPAGSYSLVAIATDSQGDQTRSTPVAVTVTASTAVPPPSAPSVPLPSSGATDVSTSVALNWMSVPDATHYDVALGTTDTPPLVSVNQTATYYQPPAALAYDTIYYWRVTAKNAGGSTAGPLWSFRTESAPSSPKPPPSTTLRRLRVMTWNVNGGRNATDLAAVAAQVSMIARSGAHIVVLQEVTIEPGADLPALYQSELETVTGRPWHAVWAEEPRSAPAVPQGNLVLSVLPLAASATITLDGAPFDPANVDAQRSAARVAVVVNGVTVTIAGTTLATDGESRTAQVSQLHSWMGSVPGPRLIGGTFKMQPHDAGYAEMASLWADVWPTLVTTPDAGITTAAFGTPARAARVDGWWQELTAGGASATEVWIVKTARSDHHAVVAEIEVR
jgi:endonuclease/exonuclease/phosphatase family metal-dependent hydrolase/regulation of enolase protein 1 (concanavalin A-like superfamily)